MASRIFVWPACAVALAVHLAWAHDDYPTAARLYAGLLCCVTLVSVAYTPARTLPAVGIGLGYFYLALGQPVFASSMVSTLRGPIHPSQRALEQATGAALIFALCVVASAVAFDRLSRPLGARLSRSGSGGPEYGPSHTAAARLVAALSMSVRTVIMLGRSFGSLSQPVGVLASPVISITLLLWDAERTRSKRASIVLWAAVVYLWATGMLSGMLGEALLPGLVAGALLWARRGHVPMGLLAVGMAVLLFFNPVKHAYRSMAYVNHDASVAELATMWRRAIEITYMDDRIDVGDTVESTTTRMKTLNQVAQIFDWVPERVPFAGPDAWLAVPSFLIPRVLWSDKPIQEQLFNKNYTFTFNLQDRRWADRTSITLPSVGDGYWRLEWLGVVVEACLLGMILGVSQGVSRARSRYALMFAVALLQARTDYHAFGLVTGCIQQAIGAMLVAYVAQWLGDAFSPPKRVGVSYGRP